MAKSKGKKAPPFIKKGKPPGAVKVSGPPKKGGNPFAKGGKETTCPDCGKKLKADGTCSSCGYGM